MDGDTSQLVVRLVRRGELSLTSILRSSGDRSGDEASRVGGASGGAASGGGVKNMATVAQIHNSGDVLTFAKGVLRLQLVSGLAALASGIKSITNHS